MWSYCKQYIVNASVFVYLLGKIIVIAFSPRRIIKHPKNARSSCIWPETSCFSQDKARWYTKHFIRSRGLWSNKRRSLLPSTICKLPCFWFCDCLLRGKLGLHLQVWLCYEGIVCSDIKCCCGRKQSFILACGLTKQYCHYHHNSNGLLHYVAPCSVTSYKCLSPNGVHP